MSFAYLPLYTGDYRRDTSHLTPQKHGVYLLLLMHCWDQKGPVPLDEQEAAGIANCRSADEIESLRYVLAKFFVRAEDGWYNTRMQREVERAENVSRVRSSAGRAGYEARSKQLPTRSHANAKQLPEQDQANAKQVHLSPPPTPYYPQPQPQPQPQKDLLGPVGPRAPLNHVPQVSRGTDASVTAPSPSLSVKQKPSCPPCPVDRIADLWNEIVGAVGGRRAINLSPARRSMIARRWTEVGPETMQEGLDWFADVFRRKIAPSRYMTGREPGHNGRIYRIGIDVALRSEQQLDEIIEGKYVP